MEHLTIQLNSPVILLFALISLLVLLLDRATHGNSTRLFFCVYRSSLLSSLSYLRMFTHILGHIDFNHYLSNMLLLLLVGPPLEEKYGSGCILYAILATAFLVGLAHFIFQPKTALLGASSIVFMMIVLSSFTEMSGKGIPLTLLVVCVLYPGRECLDALKSDQGKNRISRGAHILGGLCGLLLGLYLNGCLPPAI